MNKNRFNLDDYIINSFCSNTTKLALTGDKFSLFKDKLHLFHLDSKLYEDSLENYISYIIYNIFLKSFKDKDVNSLETYFFNVITGFAQAKGFKISSGRIAKLWVDLTLIYSQVIDVFSSPDTYIVNFNKIYNFRINALNFQSFHNCSYYLKLESILLKSDGSVEVFILSPLESKFNNVNIIISIICHIFEKNNLTKIHVVNIPTKNNNLNFSTISVTQSLKNQFINNFKDIYLDYFKINTYNCPICPVSCNYYEIYKQRYIPLPGYTSKKTIKTVNI